MMPKANTAVNKAIAFIKAGLDDETWLSGSRLPSLSHLARLAGVSRSSMWRAMKNAKKDHLVSITMGGYIIAQGGTISQDTGLNSSNLMGDRNALWREKRQCIEQAIMNGDFSRDEYLPSVKELTATYGICAATLRKVLSSLTDDGVISKQKRSFKLAPSSRIASKKSVIIIGERVSPGKLDVYNERTQKLVDTLESECARTGLSVHFLDFDPLISSADRKIQSYLRDQKEILGHLFLVPWGQQPDIIHSVNDFVIWLCKQKKPTAILDAMGTFSLPSGINPASRIQIFRTASRLAGIQAGGFALGLGHQNVAYISLLHGYDWSKKRFSGIKSRYAAAGFAKNVFPYTLDNIEEATGRSFTVGSMPLEDDARIMAIRAPQKQLEMLSDYYSQDAETQKRFGDQITAIKNSLSTLLHLQGTGIDSAVFEFIRQRAMEDVTSKHNDMLIQPLFESALINPRITAWIAANDGMATSAMRFLSSHGRRVPQDVSVIGFDNKPEALEKELTSYDFNMPGIMHRMLWHLCRYDDRKPASAQPPIEVEGMIIERGSTGRVKSPAGS